MKVLIDQKDYELVAECIRSGQASTEDVCTLFDTDPLFKIWYKHTYCLREIKNQPGKF